MMVDFPEPEGPTSAIVSPGDRLQIAQQSRVARRQWLASPARCPHPAAGPRRRGRSGGHRSARLEFTEASVNGVAPQSRRGRHRRHTAPAESPRFGRRPQPALSLVQEGTQGCELRPDGRYIAHVIIQSRPGRFAQVIP